MRTMGNKFIKGTGKVIKKNVCTLDKIITDTKNGLINEFIDYFPKDLALLIYSYINLIDTDICRPFNLVCSRGFNFAELSGNLVVCNKSETTILSHKTLAADEKFIGLIILDGHRIVYTNLGKIYSYDNGLYLLCDIAMTIKYCCITNECICVITTDNKLIVITRKYATGSITYLIDNHECLGNDYIYVFRK